MKYLNTTLKLIWNYFPKQMNSILKISKVFGTTEAETLLSDSNTFDVGTLTDAMTVRGPEMRRRG